MFAIDHLFAMQDARLQEALALLREHRQLRINSAELAWIQLARRARQMEAQWLSEIGRSFDKHDVLWSNPVMGGGLRMPGLLLNSITSSIEEHHRERFYFSALHEFLHDYWRNVRQARLRPAALRTWFDGLRRRWITLPAAISALPMVRRALGFFGAAKVDARNLP